MAGSHPVHLKPTQVLGNPDKEIVLLTNQLTVVYLDDSVSELGSKLGRVALKHLKVLEAQTGHEHTVKVEILRFFDHKSL